MKYEESGLTSTREPIDGVHHVVLDDFDRLVRVALLDGVNDGGMVAARQEVQVALVVAEDRDAYATLQMSPRVYNTEFSVNWQSNRWKPRSASM